MNPQAPIEIDILNHFYVYNMNINRKDNPTLKDYKIITKRRNKIAFVPKDSADKDMEPEALDILEDLKKLY